MHLFTQCVSPYVGDGSLCVLDSDGDGYPNLALRTCSETDSFIYCSADTCPFARNTDQTDFSPCMGDETGAYCVSYDTHASSYREADCGTADKPDW